MAFEGNSPCGGHTLREGFFRKTREELSIPGQNVKIIKKGVLMMKSLFLISSLSLGLLTFTACGTGSKAPDGDSGDGGVNNGTPGVDLNSVV